MPSKCLPLQQQYLIFVCEAESEFRRAARHAYSVHQLMVPLLFPSRDSVSAADHNRKGVGFIQDLVANNERDVPEYLYLHNLPHTWTKAGPRMKKRLVSI